MEVPHSQAPEGPHEAGNLDLSGREQPVNKPILVIDAVEKDAVVVWKGRGSGEGAERHCNHNKSQQTKLLDKKTAEQDGVSPGDIWGACLTVELRSPLLFWHRSPWLK